MYDILSNTFQSTLNREGKEIDINGTKHKVFFRRNETGNTDAYSTLFAPVDAQIKQGELFTVSGEKFLIQKNVTAENDVYRKYKAIRTNAEIKWMFGKNNLVVFDIYTDGIASSLNGGKSGITISSKAEFILPLDDTSKRIEINNRFFAGAYKMAWKITDINYMNGMCYLYAERDAILPNDDNIRGIANRFDYESRPSTYKVEFDNVETITIEELEEKVVEYSVYKDGVLMENPPLKQTFIVDDGNYMIADGIDITDTETVTEEYFKIHVDNDNITVRIEQGQFVIMGMIQGTSRITASYSQSEEDTIISDTIDVTVIEKAVVASEIEITPIYTDSGYYYLRQGFEKLFTCNINGVDAPVWIITVNPNGNSATNYTATIDNGLGTFKIKNNKMNSNRLIVNVEEETSGKTAEYQIKLVGLF